MHFFFFQYYVPFFFNSILYQAPCSQALAPSCGALVLLVTHAWTVSTITDGYLQNNFHTFHPLPQIHNF